MFNSVIKCLSSETQECGAQGGWLFYLGGGSETQECVVEDGWRSYLGGGCETAGNAEVIDGW
jgi:hypothetical protein